MHKSIILYFCVLQLAVTSCSDIKETAIPVKNCKNPAISLPEGSQMPTEVQFINRSNGYRAILQYETASTLKHRGSLNAGESLSISTSGIGRWMITDGPGNCLEIIDGPFPDNEYVITVPNQDFGPE